jgi:beta-aspartyl-peptidase (threonine type)
MEKTPHILLVGPGAEAFAAREGVELVDNGWFSTEPRRRALEEVLAREAAEGGGTAGAVALDRQGHLAAATSTGGLTGKLPGRVGDSPLIGAGTFADDRSCAVSATGRGEEFIRRGVAIDIAARVRHGGKSLGEAVAAVIEDELAPGDGGVIALDRAGTIVMRFNTSGMYRGAADARGRFEVELW